MERKVLFSASTYSHIINFHLPYLKEFRRLGWTVHAACGGEPRKIPEAQRLIHIPFEKSMTSPHNFSAAALLRRVIRQENYTLISCHTSLASFFVRLAVLGMRHRPLVACTSHGYLFDDCSPKLKQLLLSGAEQLPEEGRLLRQVQGGTGFCFHVQFLLIRSPPGDRSFCTSDPPPG